MKKRLADSTNHDAATIYYPETTGDIGQETPCGPTHGLRAYLYLKATGGVTLTVEYEPGTKSELSASITPAWLDITTSLVNLATGGTAASYVDSTCLLDISGLNGRFRIKAVFADASNTLLAVLVTD